jgi:hypothetical protein
MVAVGIVGADGHTPELVRAGSILALPRPSFATPADLRISPT